MYLIELPWRGICSKYQQVYQETLEKLSYIYPSVMSLPGAVWRYGYIAFQSGQVSLGHVPLSQHEIVYKFNCCRPVLYYLCCQKTCPHVKEGSNYLEEPVHPYGGPSLGKEQCTSNFPVVIVALQKPMEVDTLRIFSAVFCLHRETTLMTACSPFLENKSVPKDTKWHKRKINVWQIPFHQVFPFPSKHHSLLSVCTSLT